MKFAKELLKSNFYFLDKSCSFFIVIEIEPFFNWSNKLLILRSFRGSLVELISTIFEKRTS